MKKMKCCEYAPLVDKQLSNRRLAETMFNQHNYNRVIWLNVDCFECLYQYCIDQKVFDQKVFDQKSLNRTFYFK